MAKFKAIRRKGKGFRVIAKSTGKPLSKKPLSAAKAHAQLTAVLFSQGKIGHDKPGQY